MHYEVSVVKGADKKHIEQSAAMRIDFVHFVTRGKTNTKLCEVLEGINKEITCGHAASDD